jgi:hypothetical protein
VTLDVDAGNRITALWARAPDDVWAAVLVSGSAVYAPEVIRWDGVRWSVFSSYVPPTSANGASVTAFGGTAGDDVWVAADTVYPGAGAVVSHWDGVGFTDATSFGPWRHSVPRVAIIAESRGVAWLAAYSRIDHVGAADGATMFCPDASYYCNDEMPETVLSREPGGRLWATRAFGAMLTYDGHAWTPSSTGTDTRLHALVSTSDGVTRALGESGAILRHDPR